jgi:NAD(P)-dependent dehydrogenase (short-subunit alcohol dehydrogenase family)
MQRALVTGGTKGVGEAVVAALREAGATILTTARKFTFIPFGAAAEFEIVPAKVGRSALNQVPVRISPIDTSAHCR